MSNKRLEKGFTIVELLIAISLVGILFVSFGSFFTNYLSLYFGLQQDSGNAVEMAEQSEHISSVLRGLTDVNSAQANNLSVYAYFSPADTYVSLVDYYVNSAGNKVMASVTPMTSNPPVGTPIPSQTVVYTIVSNYYQKTGSSLFTYYDDNGNIIAAPVSDEHSIIELGVNLSEPAKHSKTGQQLSTVVSLRNRKTNL